MYKYEYTHQNCATHLYIEYNAYLYLSPAFNITFMANLDINQLSTAIIRLDNDNRIQQINHAAEQMLGFSNRQLENETFFELVKSELSPDLFKSFQSQERSAFIEDIELKVATGIIRANLMMTTYQTDVDVSNAKNGLILELQINTHHQNIRKDLQLQQQSRVSEHLIRSLAHEIKNPLGGIKGAAQLLERKLPKDFPQKYSQIIIRETNRLGALVDRLLMPAMPEPSQQVNPHRIIEDALEVVLLQNKNPIKVIKDYDPSLPDINISPNQIQQALLNLIKNAAEAIQALEPSDKHQGCLILSTRMMHQHNIGQTQHRQVLRIDVQDNGIGIPEEIINDIFFPTISGKQSSGLGLSIAQSLVQRHQGIIEVESHFGKTCFSLYIPIIRDTGIL